MTHAMEIVNLYQNTHSGDGFSPVLFVVHLRPATSL